MELYEQFKQKIQTYSYFDISIEIFTVFTTILSEIFSRKNVSFSFENLFLFLHLLNILKRDRISDCFIFMYINIGYIFIARNKHLKAQYREKVQ